MQHKRLYIGPRYTEARIPVFRTLGVPSGFIVALSAVLNQRVAEAPVRHQTPEEILDNLQGMFNAIKNRTGVEGVTRG